MSVSVFDLFSIGLGPSSSHTIGPMTAAYTFVQDLMPDMGAVAVLNAHLYGSLALTGEGHKTDMAVILGLSGHQPETVLPDEAAAVVAYCRKASMLNVGKTREIPFNHAENIIFHKQDFLEKHSNGMRFEALDAEGNLLQEATYYSIGGGFVVTDADFAKDDISDECTVPFPFETAEELANMCKQEGCSIAELMHENELVWHDAQTISSMLNQIWFVMQDAIMRGCQAEGILPGEIKIRRRSYALSQKLKQKERQGALKSQTDWLTCYSMAVNEENAAGGRIVTAPTNGAAGIIPAIFQYALDTGEAKIEDFKPYLLTAGAIALLYKKGASISAAEVGCQGEIGVACSMAAAALCAIKGGNVAQILHAAEMGMEHNLGLTCDPIAGLVQIPCIERNAAGSIQAYHFASLALYEEGEHFVSLDSVIRTMFETGKDMRSRYKETSLGGLAVHVEFNRPDC